MMKGMNVATGKIRLMRILGLFALAAMLQGCVVNKTTEKRTWSTTLNGWEHKEYAVELGQPRLAGKECRVDYQVMDVEKQYSIEDNIYELKNVTRTKSDVGDCLFEIFPGSVLYVAGVIPIMILTAGEICSNDYCLPPGHSCVASRRKWTENRQENKQFTGLERKSAVSSSSSVVPRMDVNLKASAGSRSLVNVSQVMKPDSTYLSIPLADWLLTADIRPELADLGISVKGYGNASRQLKLDGSALNSMGMYKETWLPVPEQLVIVKKRIRDGILARKFDVVATALGRLKELEPEQPTSFRFYYADALMRSGDKTRAVQYAREYLEQAGNEAPYAAQARAMIGQ